MQLPTTGHTRPGYNERENTAKTKTAHTFSNTISATGDSASVSTSTISAAFCAATDSPDAVVSVS